MSTATYRVHRKLNNGSYEVVHNETESGVVLRPNGRTVEQDLVALFNHSSNTANPHKVSKSQVGLSNVDNTADSVKRVSYANSAGSAGSANTATSAGVAANADPGSATLKNIYAGTVDIGAGASLATGNIYLVYE